MIHVIVFVSKNYYGNAQLLKANLENVNCIIYTEKDILDFKKENKKLFKHDIGYGLWSWKPYLILKTLENIREDEIVLYLDSGLQIINSLTPILEIIQNQDYILFHGGGKRKNKFYTKKKCFELMKCNEDKYYNATQLAGGYQGYKKTKDNILFLKEYLKYSKNYDIIGPILDSEIEDFVAHRNDQSILTNLAIKYNKIIHRDPSQYGNEDYTFRNVY